MKKNFLAYNFRFFDKKAEHAVSMHSAFVTIHSVHSFRTLHTDIEKAVLCTCVCVYIFIYVCARKKPVWHMLIAIRTHTI